MNDIAVSITTLLQPILVAGVNFLKKKLINSLVAEVTPITSPTSSIKISNSVAYGSYKFLVKNKRFAVWYDKYSIPFMSFFGSDPTYKITDPTYGFIDIKNILNLELDNIPRNQTVMIHVDTSCEVDPTEYITLNINPPNVILSETIPECMLEIINNQEFEILGLNVELKASNDECKVEIIYIRDLGRTESFPQEFIRISETELVNLNKVEFSIDLSPNEVKRFRARLQIN